jgi:WD40 repeat protein
VITALAISPDGRLLAVGELPRLGETTAASKKNDAQSAVQLWDLANRRELAVFPDLGGGVFAVAFSPDGRTLAAVIGSVKGNLRVWNVATHRAMTDPIPETNAISTLAYSPDGRTLALGVLLSGRGRPGPGAIDLWDPAGRRLLCRLTVGDGEINSLAFSPDGRLLASGSADDAAQRWDVATGTERAVLTGPSAPVTSVVFSPDGRRLAGATRDGATRVWGVPGGRLEGKFAITLPTAPAIAFSAGGRYLDIGNATNNVDVWKLATLTPARPPIRLQKPVSVMVSSPDGRTLVFGGSLGSLVALDMGQRTFYQAHGDSLWAAAVSRVGRTAATGSSDGTVQLWPTGDPAAAHVLRERQGPIDRVAFSPDGKKLATVDDHCVARIWNAVTDRRPAVLATPRRLMAGGLSALGNVSDLAFGPDGKTLATYCSSQPIEATVSALNTIIVWDTGTFRPVASYTMRAEGPGSGLAYDPDGRTLALDNGSGDVLLWDTRTHRVTGRIHTRQASPLVIEFSPDGRMLATAGENSTVGLWNVARRKLVASADQTSPVPNLAFSPDGSVLATAGQDAVVRLLTVPRLGLLADLALPAPAAPTNGLALVVNEVAFGPGGHTLVAANSDSTAQVWDLRPADEVRELCNALRGPSLARQWRQQTSAPNPCRVG